MKRLNGMDAMLLYSEAPNLHTHTVKVAGSTLSPKPQGFPGSGSRHSASTCAVGCPWGAVALPARRHPVAAASPDVGGGLRGRLGLPLASGDGAGAGAPARAGLGYRAGGVHTAGPQPPAVGVSFRRGAGRWPVRRDRQGASCAGRRRRLGETAGRLLGYDVDGPDIETPVVAPPFVAGWLAARGRMRPCPPSSDVARFDR